METNVLIKLADDLDEKGMEKEANIIDSFLKSALKIPMSKCGIKEESVDMHRELLEGYEKALEECKREYKKVMNSANEKDSPNLGKLRNILRNSTHNCNAICFHKMYIEDMIDSKPYPIDKHVNTKQLLKDLFNGGPNKIDKEIKRAAHVTRSGWVLLNFCTVEKKLCIDICDLHEIGVSATSLPVLAIDMWEHAYINDFGQDKDEYVEWCLSRIDWRKVSKRIKSYMRVK